MKRNNTVVIIIILMIISLGLFSFFGYQYICQEREMVADYDDFSRASMTESLSYDKRLDTLMSHIRLVQSSLPGEKMQRMDLIYDFAKYDYIPSLNLIKYQNNNDKLYEAFNNFSSILLYFNNINYRLREKMLQRQGKEYYSKHNEIYTYIVKKKVITKKGFNDCYEDYLTTSGFKNMEYSISKKMKTNKSFNEIYNQLKFKNEKFLQNNALEITEAVAKDLNDFTKFILNNYILADPEVQTNGPELIKSLDTEEITLIYNFTYLDKIYNSASKYYRNAYQLDINYVWEQIEAQGYPKIYM